MVKNISFSYNFILSKIFILNVNFIIRGASSSSSCYQTAVDWIKGLSKKSVLMIPCGVSSDFNNQNKTLFNSTNKYDMGYVGSFRDIHGIGKLLEFCLQYKITVKLVGDGKLYNYYTNQCKYHNSNLITFTGFIPNSEVPIHINDCNVMWGYSKIDTGDYL